LIEYDQHHITSIDACQGVNSCFFTMVAVDDERHPAPVPALQPVDGDAKRRFREALLRKQLRQELANRFVKIRQDS
jgi:acyl-CoA hydrolase